VNVNLGKVFEGGNLFFLGGLNSALKGYPASALELMEGKETLDYAHQVGKAVLHLGKHVHGARPLTKGERWNLIIWVKTKRL